MAEIAVVARDNTSRSASPETVGFAAKSGMHSALAQDWDGLVARVTNKGRQAWRAGGQRIVAEAGSPGVLVPSHRGIDGARLELAIDGHRPSLLLKVIHPDQRRYIDAAASFDAQRKAAALGCAPLILAFDSARGAALIEFLDGWRTARVNDLRKPEVMEAVLQLKRRIHSGPRLQQSWSVFDRIRVLQAELGGTIAAASDELRAALDDVFRIERLIAADGVEEVPSHADGLASNILIDPRGRVRLVDFDEARNADPYFEFGILMNEAFEREEDILPALEMFDGRAERSNLRRARLYAIADDLAWAMWGLAMDARSPRKDVEFFRYACWRMMRCRIALARVDLSAGAKWL
ncbi:MAG: phosphotransferase [Rhizobiaceae bacterium]|nr:phosphotransferase [Rhizobiaceae bacterium]